MPSMLDKIRAALRRSTSTTAQLAEALADARRADIEARSAVERQVATVAAGYLDPDAARAAARAKLADLRAEAEDAAAILAEVERRHGAAVEAEEQNRRRQLYDSAKVEADAAALALAKTYPKLAAGMVAMLKDLAQAQQAVALVNAQLPDGVAPLDDPEMAARGVAGLPRETVSDEWVELWARLDANEPTADQAVVYDCGNGWGKRPGDAQPAFRMRRFHKVVTREPVNGDYPVPLAAALQIPAVSGSGMLWGDAFPAFNPAFAMAVTGQAEPDAVLARLAEIETAATTKPTHVKRALRVEWPEYAEVVPLPEAPPRDRRAGQPSGTGSRFGASPFGRPGARAGTRR